MSFLLFIPHIIPKAASQIPMQVDLICMRYARPIILNGITGSSQVRSSQYPVVQYMRYMSMLMITLNMMMMPMMMIQIEKPCIHQLVVDRLLASLSVEYVEDADTMVE
jgi:hypothetical protein